MLVDSLNEEKTSITRGRNRNTMVTKNTAWEKENFLLAARLA
jgi:hypothetical protein